MEQFFRIDGQFEGMNEILALAKKHWSNYAAVKKANTLRAWVAIKAARIQPVKRPVLVSFSWYCKDRRTDKDNLVAGGRKPILDALEKAGILKRDSWNLVAGFDDTFYLDKDEPCVIVTLQEVDP